MYWECCFIEFVIKSLRVHSGVWTVCKRWNGWDLTRIDWRNEERVSPPPTYEWKLVRLLLGTMSPEPSCCPLLLSCMYKLFQVYKWENLKVGNIQTHILRCSFIKHCRFCSKQVYNTIQDFLIFFHSRLKDLINFLCHLRLVRNSVAGL